MNNALIYLGKYSPVLMGILDSAQKNNFDSIIFLDTSAVKSKVNQGLCLKHIHIKSKDDIHSEIEGIANTAEHVFCMTLSYQDSLTLHSFSFQTENITICGAKPKQIKELQNKEVINNIAKESKLPLLPDIDLNSSDIEEHFPLVLRPKDESTANFKVEYIENQEELSNFDAEDVVAQPYISGPNIVVHVARFNDELDCKSFIVNYKFEGVTLTLEHYKDSSPLLISQIETFLQKLEFSGIGHFEFILNETSNEYYFLDFNGRFGGTSLKAAALGFNEFSICLDKYKIIKNIMPTSTSHKLASNPLALLKCIKSIIVNDKCILDYPNTNSLTYLYNIIKIFLKSKNELSFPAKNIRRDYISNFLVRKFKR